MKKLSPRRRLERNWILYDVGNSAFTLLISTIMPIYFNYLAGEGGTLLRRQIFFKAVHVNIVVSAAVHLGKLHCYQLPRIKLAARRAVWNHTW